MGRISDQAERYDSMIQFLKETIKENSQDVSIDVKDLFNKDLNYIIFLKYVKKLLTKLKQYVFRKLKMHYLRTYSIT